MIPERLGAKQSDCQRLADPAVRGTASPVGFSSRIRPVPRLQVAYSYGIGVGGTLAVSYLFHRMGQHKRERITPLIVATPTAVLGGLNFRF